MNKNGRKGLLPGSFCAAPIRANCIAERLLFLLWNGGEWKRDFRGRKKGSSGFLVGERPVAAEVLTHLDGSWNGAEDMAEGSRPSKALMVLSVYPLSVLMDEFRSAAWSGQGRAGFARRSEPLTARTAGQQSVGGKGDHFPSPFRAH
jgi:hypothetical protein